MQITMRQIEAAYEVATQVFERKIAVETGARSLQKIHGLNVRSARDIINDHRLMLQGKEFQRTMSAPAIDYFLTRIAAARGLMAVTLAIKAVYKHIDYYERIRKRKPKYRDIERRLELLARPAEEIQPAAIKRK